MKKLELTPEVIKHQKLIDKIKGYDVENYKALARRSGMTLQEVKDAMGRTEANTIVTWIENRIEFSEKYDFSKDYINALRDTLKIAKRLHAK